MAGKGDIVRGALSNIIDAADIFKAKIEAQALGYWKKFKLDKFKVRGIWNTFEYSEDYLKQYYEEKRDNPIRISGVKRVRFKKALRPDDLLSITINQENKGQDLAYSFKVLLKEEIACTGIISVEQLP